MQHRYEPVKLTNENSIILSRFGGQYYKIQCSCGLYGVGNTPSEAMEHINNLHEGNSTLLFFDFNYLNLDDPTEFEIAI